METSTITEELSNTTPVPRITRCSAYDSDIYSTVATISLISSAISLTAVCFIPFFVILFKQWSFFNQRLILYLSLTSIINLVTFMTARASHEASHEGFCIFSAFISQLGSWMNLNAYICITATLLLKVFFLINLEKLDIPVIFFIFLSPLLFNWIPFIKHSYGNAGPLCWIRSSQEVNGTCELHVFGQVLQLVLWYIPLYLMLSIMIIMYVVILAKFCKQRRKWTSFGREEESERNQAMNYALSLLAYPLVYFLINIFPFINRIHGATNPRTPSPVLWFLSLIFFPQHGTGIAFVFLFSIRQKLKLSELKSAIYEWHRKTQIKDYPVTDGVTMEEEPYKHFD